MNAVLLQLLITLLTAIAPAVADLIVALLKKLTADLAPTNDNAAFYATVKQIVANENLTPDTLPDVKRERAKLAIQDYATRQGVTVSDSVVNALIELNVNQIKVEA